MKRVVLGLLFVLAANPAMGQETPAMPVKAESPAKATAAPAAPKSMTLTLTDQEAAVLLRFIDLAVRQGGLNEAGNAAYLASKIKDAATKAGVAQAAPAKSGASP